MAIKNQQQTEDAQQLFLTATVSHEDLGMTTGQNVAAHRRRLGRHNAPGVSRSPVVRLANAPPNAA